MKLKKLTTLAALVLALSLLMLSFASCGSRKTPEELWRDATYTEAKSFGEGAKTVSVTVECYEYSVVLTLKTDREMLGDALLDHGLIEGTPGAYGLYIDRVNGILTDYNADQSYWSLEQNGTVLMTGVDYTPIADGEAYELVYTR